VSLINQYSTVWYHQELGMNYRELMKRAIAIVPNMIHIPSPIEPPLELALLDFSDCTVTKAVVPAGIAAEVVAATVTGET
jgi:hypothetical protein